MRGYPGAHCMNPPDSRLLCLAKALPFTPEGVRAWIGNLPITVNRHGDGVGPQDLVDFSAPTLSHGVPTRMDAFRDFGLKALHRDASHIERCGSEAFRLDDGRGRLIAVIATHDAGFAIGGGVESIVLNPWPDLSGLTSDDAERAILVAALTARKTP